MATARSLPSYPPPRSAYGGTVLRRHFFEDFADRTAHRLSDIVSVKIAVAQLFGHLAVQREQSPEHRLERVVVGKLGNVNLLLTDLIKHIVKRYAPLCMHLRYPSETHEKRLKDVGILVQKA